MPIHLFLGGRSAEDQFNPYIYKLTVESAASGSLPKVRWERVNVVGGKVYDQRLAGHTAVYHSVRFFDNFYNVLLLSTLAVTHPSDPLHSSETKQYCLEFLNEKKNNNKMLLGSGPEGGGGSHTYAYG